MLIEFSVGNFRSFYTPMTLSLLASKLRERGALDHAPIISTIHRWPLLRSTGVLGPNASGKSNLIKALGYMRFLVLESATGFQLGESTRVERFALKKEARTQPAFFQIVFLDEEGVQYRYGFELDEKQIHSEWLYRTRKREARLFIREGQTFEISSRFAKEERGLEKLTRPNALFLSVLAQFNSPLGGRLLQWFRKNLGVVSGIDDERYLPFTLQRMSEDRSFHRKMVTLLKLADIGIRDVRIESLTVRDTSVPEDMQRFFEFLAQRDGMEVDEITLRRAKMAHTVFSRTSPVGEIEFDLTEESAGTQKFFALLGPVIDTLERGSVLAVDEFDARLHPMLTRELIRLFNSPETNPHNAQLIFATHDVSLLGEILLRRDQIWFTEKTRFGETELYSLAEIKERKDASFLKNYLLGRYGAVPYIGGLRAFVEQELQDATEKEVRPAEAA